MLAFILIATTQPTTQNNLKQLLLGWYYYRLKTPGLITILAVLDNLGSWLSVCNLIWTQLDLFLMEDNLNFWPEQLACTVTELSVHY